MLVIATEVQYANSLDRMSHRVTRRLTRKQVVWHTVNDSTKKISEDLEFQKLNRPECERALYFVAARG